MLFVNVIQYSCVFYYCAHEAYAYHSIVIRFYKPRFLIYIIYNLQQLAYKCCTLFRYGYLGRPIRLYLPALSFRKNLSLWKCFRRLSYLIQSHLLRVSGCNDIALIVSYPEIILRSFRRLGKFNPALQLFYRISALRSHHRSQAITNSVWSSNISPSVTPHWHGILMLILQREQEREQWKPPPPTPTPTQSHSQWSTDRWKLVCVACVCGCDATILPQPSRTPVAPAAPNRRSVSAQRTQMDFYGPVSRKATTWL